MSRLDALPADQRSVLALLLRQGKGYDDLAGPLRMETGEVRARAHDALDALGPGANGLASERRQAIADWLLGQQAPDDATATHAFLSGSPAGRAWAEAVAGELRPLAGDRLPAVPAGEAVPPGEATVPGEATPPEGATPSAGAAPPNAAATPNAAAPAPRVSRRGGAVLIGVVLAAVVGAVLFLVLSGGSDDKGQKTASAASTTQTKPQVKAQVNLTPPQGAPAAKALAIVQIVDVGGQQAINAVAQGLPSTDKAAYGIWAYTSPSVTRLIGGFDKKDDQGHLVYQGALPQDVTDITRYKEILVTRETSGSPKHPGRIYLRGPMQGS